MYDTEEGHKAKPCGGDAYSHPAKHSGRLLSQQKKPALDPILSYELVSLVRSVGG